ncbi:MAG: phosphate signaling complex protein PhoU [Burkholderiaceae bacterium]
MAHTNTIFNADLTALRLAATSMAGLVERQFTRAVSAVRDGDLDLIAQILTDEAEVNRMHVQIDLRCHQMIARLQPIAVDLREIIAVLHMNNDFERIGDEAKKIAKKARDLRGRQLPVPLEKLDRMTTIVSEMLLAATDAFVRQDATASEPLNKRDKDVDRLRDEITADLLRVMGENPEAVAECLTLVFIVQSIERVGDHAKNVAEYVVTVVEGVDPRHRRSVAAGKAAKAAAQSGGSA